MPFSTMRLASTLLFVTVVASLPLLARHSEVWAASQPDILASIIKAWNKRQNDVRSLDFRVGGTEFCPQRPVSAAELAGDVLEPAIPFTLPDVTFPIKIRLVLDEHGRSRLEYEGKIMSGKERGYVSKSDVNLFDGSVRKTFFAEGPLGFPNAHIQEGDTRNVARDTRVLPLLIVYRPFDALLGFFDPKLLRLTEDRGVVDRQECFILKQGETSIWVANNVDFVPIRYYEYRQGKLIQMVENRYSQDQNNGRVLAGWTNARYYGQENLIESVAVEVSEAHINVPIPDRDFDVPLPPGTWVNNYITDESFILREDGKQRPVKPGEWNGANYEDLCLSGGSRH